MNNKKPASDKIQRFLDNDAKLIRAQGSRLPPWNEHYRLFAQAALADKPLKKADNPLAVRHILDFLACGYVATNNEAYAEKARAVLKKALTNLPEMTYHQTLGISFMLGNTIVAGWLGCLGPLSASPVFDGSLFDRVFNTAVRYMAFLHDNICPMSMNFRQAHADCLLMNGLRLQGLTPQAEKWIGLGTRALNDAFHRQWQADGSHIERNPHYHAWPLVMMDAIHMLQQAMPELGLRLTTQKLALAYDYALMTTSPNGDENGMHDSQAIRTGKTRNYMRKYRDAFRKRNNLPIQDPNPRQFFPDAGQILLRDNWSENATYITFDAGKCYAEHMHRSRNAIQVHAHGRTLLCDSGWLSHKPHYTDTPLAWYAKSTRAHNTLNLNAWTQSVADPCRTRYSAGEDVDLVESTFEGGYYPGEVYFGYRTPMGKGIWASHQRILYWAHGRFILTLDNIRRERLAEPELEADLPSLECNWQFSEGGNGLKLDPDAARALTTYPESNLLMLMPLLPNGIKWTVYEGQQDPPRGWVAGPCFEGITIPAPQLNLRLPAMKGIFGEFAAVLIPFAGVKPPEVKAQARPAIPDEIFWKGAKSIGEVNLLWGNGSTDAVHWSYRLDQTLDQAINGIETDGAMLHLHRDPAGVIQYGYAMDATYVLPYQPKPRSKPGAIKFKATP